MGEDVVEFTGSCIYKDVEIQANLQFILDIENGRFEAGALSVNDVAQSTLIIASLLEITFDESLNDPKNQYRKTIKETKHC